MALTTVDAVAGMLRWSAAERAKFDAQIPVYIAAASQIVENEAGPFDLRTVAHIADGGASIALPSRVTMVESVHVVGGVEPLTGWVADLAAGVVYGPFPRGRRNIQVKFTTGFAVAPEAAQLAATMVAADMWAIASQRAPGLDDQVDPAYLTPKVVRNLLAPFKTMPGFA